MSNFVERAITLTITGGPNATVFELSPELDVALIRIACIEHMDAIKAHLAQSSNLPSVSVEQAVAELEAYDQADLAKLNQLRPGFTFMVLMHAFRCQTGKEATDGYFHLLLDQFCDFLSSTKTLAN